MNDSTTTDPPIAEALTLSDDALIAFVDFVRMNHPKFTRDPHLIRRVLLAYAATDQPSEVTA